MDKTRILYNILAVSDEGKRLFDIHQSREMNNVVVNLKELGVEIRTDFFWFRLRISGMPL
jgi:hypothetical protein